MLCMQAMSDLQSEIDSLDQLLMDPIKAFKNSVIYGAGATTGAAIGGICFGPVGALVGAGIGLLGAYKISSKASVGYSDIYSYINIEYSIWQGSSQRGAREALPSQLKSWPPPPTWPRAVYTKWLNTPK